MSALFLKALLIGLGWFAALAFFEFGGFWRYCHRRSIIQPEGHGSAIFKAARKRLFSRGWYLSSIFSVFFVCLGLTTASSFEENDRVALLGIYGALIGLGITLISMLYRFDKLYSEAIRTLPE